MPDLLFETAGNPVPANAHAGMLAMPGGKRLRYARFAAENRPLQGTVLILPGRNEQIEKYFETVRDLSDRGFGTAIFDLRGQGGSDRLLRDPDRGHIEDFQDYVDDIGPFFEEIMLPDCRAPYFVLGHSTGALVALLAAPLLINRVQRMVLSAPLLGFADTPLSMRNTLRLASLLNMLGLGTVYMSGGPPTVEPTPFARNVLTSDPERYTRNTMIQRLHPELMIGGPTAAWVRAACLAMNRVHEPGFAAKLDIPVLLLAAGADRVVDTQAAERFARRLRAGALLTIDGARHELLQEADVYREQVLAAFDAFVPGGS